MCPRALSSRTGERAAALAAGDVRTLASALAIAPADPAGVHEVRNSARCLRSLRVPRRRARGKDAVDAIDPELRALAKDPTAQRDGHVVQDTARPLAGVAADARRRAHRGALLPPLTERPQHRLAGTLREDPGFMHRQAERRRQRPWHCLHGRDLRDALARSICRHARAQASALASGAVDDLHGRRRRSRQLRMRRGAMRALRGRPPIAHHTTGVRHVARFFHPLGVLQNLALLTQAVDALQYDHPHDPPRPRFGALRHARTPSPIHPPA